MPRLSQRWSVRFGFLAAIADGLWSSQALAIERGVDAVSNVEVSGLIVWIYLHLPAALTASWIAEKMELTPADSSAPFTASILICMAFLGATQSALIAAGLGHLLDRRARS